MRQAVKPSRNAIHPERPPMGPNIHHNASLTGAQPKTPSEDAFDLYEPQQIRNTVGAIKICPSNQQSAFSSTAISRPAKLDNKNACFQVLNAHQIFDTNAQKVFKMHNIHGENDTIKDIYTQRFQELIVDSLQCYSNCNLNSEHLGSLVTHGCANSEKSKFFHGDAKTRKPGLIELVLQTILAFTEAKGKLRVAQETVIRVSSFAIIDETIVNLLQQRKYGCEVSSELFLGTAVSELVEVTLKSLDSMMDELNHARSAFAKQVAHSSSHNKKLKQTQVLRIVVELGEEKGEPQPRYSVINLVNLVDFEIGYLLQNPEEPALATEGRSLYALMQTFAHLTEKTRKLDHGSTQSCLEMSQLTLYLKPMLQNNGKVGVLFCISGNVHDYGVNITTLWQYKNWLKFTTYDLPNTKRLKQSKLQKLKKEISKTEDYIAISHDVSLIQDPRLSQTSKQTFIQEKFTNQLKLSQLKCQIQKPGSIYPLFLSAKQIMEIENIEERERTKYLKASLIERFRKVMDLLKTYSAHQSEFDLLKPVDFDEIGGLPDYLLQQTDPFQDFADTEERKSELLDYGIDAEREEIPRASLCFQNIREHQLETILQEIEDGISQSPESRAGSFIFFDKLASIVSMQDDNPFNR